jgi:hypothetical protein
MSDELEYAAAAAQGEVFDCLERIVELTTRVEAQATIIRDQGGWLAELKAQLHEVREIYTGMEGIPKNLYTTEAYLMYIIKQMYDAALEAGDG